MFLSAQGDPMSLIRIAAVAAIAGLVAAPAALLPARGEPARDADAASPWVELHASRARLVTGNAAKSAAVRLAGLEIAMAEGWKTYWRMPGDAGVPPQFDWAGSRNVASVKVLYPAPTRMAEAGGEAVGYKHAVLFPIEVTPQDPGKPVTLQLALELGICRDICVPVTANLKALLQPGGKGAQSAAIEAALGRVPRAAGERRPTDPELRQVTVGNGEGGARLHIAAAFPGGRGADVFVEAPDGFYVPMPRRQAQDADGVIRFASDLPGDVARDLKGKTLTFTLVSEAGATETQWRFP
jgi:DsbC/DsbD-like thiol-disulfide interchange protein